MTARPFPWQAAMGFAFAVLRLPPAAFWSMTPRELAAAIRTRNGGVDAAPLPDDLAALMAAFPDRTATQGSPMMETIDFTAQTAALDDTRSRLNDLNGLAERFGTTLTRSFAGGIARGKNFDDILRSVGQKFIDIGMKTAFQPLEGLVTSGLGGLTRGLGGLLSGGIGGSAGPVMPFADGGVIAAPSYFPLGRGTGVAGEAGPEAILPLTRGADGRLGVSAGGSGSAPVYVTIQARDVESFARSEAQVSAALARAVARGRRAT